MPTWLAVVVGGLLRRPRPDREQTHSKGSSKGTKGPPDRWLRWCAHRAAGGCLHVEHAPNTVRGSTGGRPQRLESPEPGVLDHCTAGVSTRDSQSNARRVFFFLFLSLDAAIHPGQTQSQGAGRDREGRGGRAVQRRNEPRPGREGIWNDARRAVLCTKMQGAASSSSNKQQIPVPVSGPVCWPPPPSSALPASGAAPLLVLLASVLTTQPGS